MMATRLATQRNFAKISTSTTSVSTTTTAAATAVTITPETNKNGLRKSLNQRNNNNNDDEDDTTSTLSVVSSAEIVSPPTGVITLATRAQTPGEKNSTSSQTNFISLQQVLAQKKLLLHTNDSSNVTVIINPLNSSESTDTTASVPQIIKTTNIDPNSVTEANTSTLDAELSPTDSTSSSSIAQVATEQVTILQAQSPNDGANQSFIAVTVQADAVGAESYQVQYVDPELYHGSSQNQNQMTYPFCAVGDYQTNNHSYYTTTGNYTTATNSATSHTSSVAATTALPYIVSPDESLLLSSSSSQGRDSPENFKTTEVTYIPENHSIHQTSTATATTDTETSDISPNISHATRISPATVAWLLENYETAEGVSLPRSTLYNHYMQHCNENKLDAVNAASFGKLIRSVFTGLRTRRLGTRGNSKYHYYGIRVKPGSALNQTMEMKPHANYPSGSGNSTSTGMSIHHKGIKRSGPKQETYEACSQFLGDGSNAIPIFPNIEREPTMPNEITNEDIEIFRSMYRDHCALFLDAVLSLEFSSIETLWKEFWHISENNNEMEKEKQLNKKKLYALCQYKNVQDFVKMVDFAFYQNMVEVLIPDVLRSIPNSLTQAIRNFAKNMEIWLCESMHGCPEKIIKIKSSAVFAFCQTLRRYTSLNHLAQAARAVLQNSSQIAQMLNDLNRVDFRNVQEQAAWVCQCDTSIVQRLENDFKAALQQQNTLEQWAAWLRLVVDSALEQYRGKPYYARVARQFLLKWSFFSSMVIRDLTLRSASSFGSFHLIRLLYDEYMFFLIEHKVAEAQQTTAIAVISEYDKRQSSPEYDFKYPVDYRLETNCKRMKC